MKILFCGDIVGKSGRNAVVKYINVLKQKLHLDLVIANAENAAHGFGITPKIYDELFNNGIDAFTLGNHFLDQPIISEYLNNKLNIVRPLNIKNEAPGKGFMVLNIKGYKILIISVLGQLFMKQNVHNPFTAIDNLLKKFKLQEDINAIIIDIHAETTSEKNALFMYLNGRVSAILGTHTHMPTSDYRILAKGTGVQTDVGMCGDYDSVVGMNTETSLPRFLNPQGQNCLKPPRLKPATQRTTLCATLLEINMLNGLACDIRPIIVGDVLQNTIDLT